MLEPKYSSTKQAVQPPYLRQSKAMQPDNLLSLKDDMIAFIAGHGMRRMPGYVTEEVPTVLYEDDTDDAWKDFVEHAKAAALRSSP